MMLFIIFLKNTTGDAWCTKKMCDERQEVMIDGRRERQENREIRQ